VSLFSNVPVAVLPTNSVVALQNKVMIALPWMKQTNPMTAFCVAQLTDKRRTASLLNFGDAFVAHSRNTCADLFLQSGLEYVLMIDDDMVVPFGNATWFNAHTGFNFPERFAGFNAIDRLLSHKKSLVGALYFGRQPNGSKPVFNEGCSHKAVDADCRKTPRDEIHATKWVGTGCMLIHRNVFLDIEKRFPLLARGPNGMGGHWFSSSEHSAMDGIRKTMEMLSDGPMTGEKAARAHAILSSTQAEARSNSCLGMGEDVSFCVRASISGHQPYVDYGCVCGHAGTYVFGPRRSG
jgi:hypothetical protein